MKKSDDLIEDESLREGADILCEIFGEIYYIDDFSGELCRYEIKALVGSG